MIEQVAGAPLVEFPMFACFDDAGRLYVAEGSGKNISGKELEKSLPCKIALLEDTDGDGKFDKRTVFADKLIFPAGVLWHEGKVYVASPPGIWVFEDGDGRADLREQLVTGFAHDDYHCPNSKYARLDLKGGLYRIRRTDVKPVQSKKSIDTQAL